MNLTNLREELIMASQNVTQAQMYQPPVRAPRRDVDHVQEKAEAIRAMAVGNKREIADLIAQEMSPADGRRLKALIAGEEERPAPGRGRQGEGGYPALTGLKNLSHPYLPVGEVVIAMYPTKDGKHYARVARAYGKVTLFSVSQGDEHFTLASNREIVTFFRTAADRILGILVRTASPGSSQREVYPRW